MTSFRNWQRPGQSIFLAGDSALDLRMISRSSASSREPVGIALGYRFCLAGDAAGLSCIHGRKEPGQLPGEGRPRPAVAISFRAIQAAFLEGSVLCLLRSGQ